MSGAIDDDLVRRTRALLEPGEIALKGAIVRTDLGSDDDLEMTEATLEIGEIVATHAGYEPTDTYVYSGADDPEFASNQHQGRLLADDGFVWECQQLLRDGTFDLVFYYEASADHEAILEAVRAAGYGVTGVEVE